MLDHEGAAGPEDVALIGDADSVTGRIEAMSIRHHRVRRGRVLPRGRRRRTREVLAGLL